MGHNMNTMNSYIRKFLDLDADVVVFDRPGYSSRKQRWPWFRKGSTTGPLVEGSTLIATEAVFHHIKQNLQPYHKIFFWGFSFGGGMAVHMAAKYQGSVIDSFDSCLTSRLQDLSLTTHFSHRPMLSLSGYQSPLKSSTSLIRSIVLNLLKRFQKSSKSPSSSSPPKKTP